MRIGVAVHCVDRYKQYNGLGKMNFKKVEKLVIDNFISTYQYWKILPSYNFNAKAVLGKEVFVFEEYQWNFELITYYILDREKKREHFQAVKREKLDRIKRKNKETHKNTLKPKTKKIWAR